MLYGKVGGFLGTAFLGAVLGWSEGGEVTAQVLVQFLSQSLVVRLWRDTLLFHDCEHAHRLNIVVFMDYFNTKVFIDFFTQKFSSF